MNDFADEVAASLPPLDQDQIATVGRLAAALDARRTLTRNDVELAA